MKKTLLILISFTILLSILSTNGIAADTLLSAVTPAYDAENNLYYNVSVWAKFDASNKGNSVVIEMVKKSKGFSADLSDEDIYYIDETIIASDGTAKFDFKLKEFDEYTVRFTSNDFNVGNSARKDIKLLSEAESVNLIHDILESDDIADKLADNADNLNLNLDFFSKLNDKTPVEAALTSNKANINITNFNSYFDEAVIFSYLKQTEDPEDIIDMFEYYEDSYLKFDQSSPAKTYETYTEMDVNTKGKLIDRLKKISFNSFESLRDAFNENVILTALANYDKEKLDKVFLDNGDYVSLPGYSSLAYADKSDILSNLVADNTINTVDELESRYIKYFTDINTPGVNAPAGGGGGGGGAPVSSNATVDKELIKNETPDEMDLSTDFTDLDSHNWAKAAIEELAKREILNGKGNRKFCPGDNITREEFVKITVLAFDLYSDLYECEFTDVSKNDWFYTYVASGKEAGLVVGMDDGSYGVGKPITRQDMAVMVHRLLAKLNKMDRVSDMSKEYNDMKNVSGYALNSVKILLNAGIMQGDNNMFYPLKNATRAEAAQLIFNIINSINS